MGKIEKQVEEYLNYCEKVREMSSMTIKMKRSILQRFVKTTGLKDIRKLTNKIFSKWIMALIRRGVSARSVNTYNAIVLTMVRYFREIGVAIPLKTSFIKKMKEGVVRRKFYTASEIKMVLKYADFETRLMIEIMFDTGMRIAELTRLRVENFEGRKVQFIGKGRKLREAYIREETLTELEEFLREKKILSGCLFGALNGEPPTTMTIRKRLKKPFSDAGFEDFYPHALRHSFATNLQLKGASVEEIKEMIGHESVATTERYLHGFEGRLEELFDRYG